MAAQHLNAMAFPKLTEEQMTQLARYAGASTKTFRAGEALFRAGDRDRKFFVIRSGELEIIDITGDQPKKIRIQGPGEFTAGEKRTLATAALFSFIGATPRWQSSLFTSI
jgi:thioredoxin reductase (NADPH)